MSDDNNADEHPGRGSEDEVPEEEHPDPGIPLDREESETPSGPPAPAEESDELTDGSDLGSDVTVEAGAEVEPEEEDGLLGGLQIGSTDDIEVPDRLVDQVIGQDDAATSS